jgi:aryl-alcohol dehydrogenase-like predicted oxidoreductase
MRYRALGRTGVRVSALALGCMNFGGRADEKQSAAVIAAALDAGLNFVDTADVYGHDPATLAIGRGRSEEIVGRALAGRRDSVVLATKAHFPMSDDPNGGGSTRRHLIAACEASLRRLGTDHIDLYQLHHPTNDVPIDETLRALDDLVRAGKIRYFGTSNFAAWQVMEALWASSDLRLHRVVSEQPPYHLLDRRVERELLPMARTYGIAVLPWSPTAGGFLAGRYRRGEPVPVESRFAEFWSGCADTHLRDRPFAVLDKLTTIGAELSAGPGQVALAWVLAQPGVTSPIIGPRTVPQLTDYVRATELTLADEHLKALDEVAPPGGVTVPYHGHDGFTWVTWGPHRHRW